MLPSQVAGLLGMQEFNADEVSGKLESILPVIQKVNEQFQNPVCTQFYFSDLFIHNR